MKVPRRRGNGPRDRPAAARALHRYGRGGRKCAVGDVSPLGGSNKACPPPIGPPPAYDPEAMHAARDRLVPKNPGGGASKGGVGDASPLGAALRLAAPRLIGPPPAYDPEAMRAARDR